MSGLGKCLLWLLGLCHELALKARGFETVTAYGIGYGVIESGLYITLRYVMSKVSGYLSISNANKKSLARWLARISYDSSKNKT